MHLSQFRDRMPSQLSGGQRQRMALARALAVEPSVLLLDEPFGALDAKVRKELRDWLRRLHDEVHTTTIFVTHDQEEALEVADEIVVINDGRVEQIGSPDTLYDKPANDFVMRFLGETTDLAGRTVRPHDIEVAMQPGALGATAGTVTRILRVGFEVRVTVTTEDGDEVLVTMTRTLARNLGVEEGAKVWLTAAKGATTVPVMAAVPPADPRLAPPASSPGRAWSGSVGVRGGVRRRGGRRRAGRVLRGPGGRGGRRARRRARPGGVPALQDLRRRADRAVAGRAAGRTADAGVDHPGLALAGRRAASYPRRRRAVPADGHPGRARRVAALRGGRGGRGGAGAVPGACRSPTTSSRQTPARCARRS